MLTKTGNNMEIEFKDSPIFAELKVGDVFKHTDQCNYGIYIKIMEHYTYAEDAMNAVCLSTGTCRWFGKHTEVNKLECKMTCTRI